MRKALVIDDESDAREFVRAILQEEGWEVAEAPDGEAGLEQARALQPDLIILDVQMPKMGGFLVFSELIKDPDTKDCKVVMLTGVRQKAGIGFSADDMGEFIGEPPDAYVEKPIDPEAFLRVIGQVMSAS